MSEWTNEQSSPLGFAWRRMWPRLHLCDAMPDSARGMASQRCSFFSLPRNERAGGRVGLVGKTQHRGPRVRACRSIADMSSSSSSWRHIKLEGCGNTECHCELLGLGGARQVERERERVALYVCPPVDVEVGATDIRVRLIADRASLAACNVLHPPAPRARRRARAGAVVSAGRAAVSRLRRVVESWNQLGNRVRTQQIMA